MAPKLHIDNISNIDSQQISRFINTGLCYIKIPEDIFKSLIDIRNQSLVFFHLPSDDKGLYPITEGDGFLDQTKTLSANIQRYIYRNQISSPDVQKIQSQLNTVRKYIWDDIFYPILNKITNFLDIDECFTDFVDSPDQTMSLIYYPPSNQNDQRIKGHKDISAMTALWAPEAGLSSRIDNDWVESPCDELYISIQIGLALELATDKQCHGLKHRVNLCAGKERFSLASFFSPNMSRPLINYKTKTIITENFGELVRQHVQETYED